MENNTAILQDGDRWALCANPAAVLQTARPGEIRALLEEVEAACRRRYFAAGCLAYEAAPGFDPAFTVSPRSTRPLAWFALYRNPVFSRRLPAPEQAFRVGAWRPDIARRAYRRAIASIRRYIAAGDTYQVNYTFRLRARFHGDPFALFHSLVRAQQARYSAFINAERFAICSASPELFLDVRGRGIRSCPMKGTAPRGLTPADDDAIAAALAQSEKNRAENVMIVDMVRNDLGRVAAPGSVKVASLFDVERYPTVLQMTSTVVARSAAPFAEIMAATFPCASITGAPKARTMRIIREVERSPRGFYTGAVGWIAPGASGAARRARFNVAIRTMIVDKPGAKAEYGTGGGIVWDSRGEQEHKECLTKARVLMTEYPEFRLLETMLWTPRTGYFLLDRHLRRLADSARYFNFRLNEDTLICRLIAVAGELPVAPHVVRLLIDRNGGIRVETRPHVARPRAAPVRAALARTPVRSDNVFLYHKTTNRGVYESARSSCPEADDVILWNERGEVTESTVCNIVARIGNKMFTPPVGCGLLAGAFRRHLLEQGRVTERVIHRNELARAQALCLVNSVRKWASAELIGFR
ncbi:MAG: aminodeoxychorismate synthase component I [Verrucomicrobiota bacterium]|nr:aminodeoxychorismate synthase component I [Verrucomicrobiota bacterium]